MKLTLDFHPLTMLCQIMGASLISWEPSLTQGKTLEIREINIEVDSKELERIERDPETGIFKVDGRTVILYIKDTRLTREKLETDPKSGPKYHLLDCRRLIEMKESGKFERYVLTSRDTGLFNVSYVEPFSWNPSGEEIEVPLQVCHFCLDALNYEKYRLKNTTERREYRKKFNLPRFLKENNTDFISLPSRDGDVTRIKGYSDDWKEISDTAKAKASFRCKCCGVDLSFCDAKGLLQTHHINGVKSDNRPENLKVLCKECHSKEPDHGHIQLTLQERAKLAEFRRLPSSRMNRPRQLGGRP